jgi:pimeloyl-ACP methyl ester carboxylesterase
VPYLTTDDGVRLWYDDSGHATGQVVVFAHEFGGDPRSWNDQIAAFAPTSRCIRYAARGFAPSDVPAEKSSYGQDRSTRDLEHLADHLGLEGFHLVGCSMGSFTSLMFACRQPRRLASLTLCGVSSGPHDDAERAAYHTGLSQEIAMLVDGAGEGSARWFREDIANATLAAKHPRRWDDYLERTLHQSHHGALMTVSTLHWDRISLKTIRDQLAAIQARVLLIYGEEDLPRVDETSRWLSEILPRNRLCPVPGTSHLVQVEEPEYFNKELDQLIEETAS